MAISYRDQLRDPRWQKKRLEAMEACGWSCENCGEKTLTFNVHHKRYIKGRMAWEYAIEELSVLCEPCHEQEHQDRELLERLVAEAGPGMLPLIIGVAGGYLDASMSIEDPGLGFMFYESSPMYYELGAAAVALESGGIKVWRDVIRNHVKTSVHTTPVLRSIAEKFDEEENQK